MPNPTPPRLHHPAELAPSSPPRVVDEERIEYPNGSSTRLVLEEHRGHFAVVERRSFGLDHSAASRYFCARIAAERLRADIAHAETIPAPPAFAEMAVTS